MDRAECTYRVLVRTIPRDWPLLFLCFLLYRLLFYFRRLLCRLDLARLLCFLGLGHLLLDCLFVGRHDYVCVRGLSLTPSLSPFRRTKSMSGGAAV